MADKDKWQALDIKTPIAMIRHWSAHHPNDPFMHQPRDGHVDVFTWAQVEDKALRLAAGLRAMGFNPGERIAILSKNCAQWCIADLAIQAAGLVAVPIYPTAAAGTVETILTHAGCRAIFVGKLDDPVGLAVGIPDHLTRIALPYDTVDAAHRFDEIIANNEPLNDRQEPDLEALMTLVYTSGSTGVPKGVMLSYRSYAGTAISTRDHFDMGRDARLFSHLPLAHIADRSVNFGVSLYSGCQLFFAESLETFQNDMRRAAPTHFATVPRLWMKFQSSILDQIPQRRLDLLLKIPVVNSMLKKKLREALGLHNTIQFGSGAAPISPAVIAWFDRLGIHIVQGYGMSETSGLATTHWPLDRAQQHTVGQQIKGFDIEVDESGEVLISGVGLFTGYYKEPELTQEVFDGTWIRSGDRGFINDAGHLEITGRAKEIFKTAKAKYVAPVPIEALLAENTDLEQICVTGAGLPQPVAIGVLSPGAKKKSRQNVEQGLVATLDQVNARLEPHERVAGILLAAEDWSVDNGLLTPTMKLKRDPIEAKFADRLDSIASQKVSWEAVA